jgi:hypothetical protein
VTAFFLFEAGGEPDFFLIPGYTWRKPTDLLKDCQEGDKTDGPDLQLSPTRIAQQILDQYRFSSSLLQNIVKTISTAT